MTPLRFPSRPIATGFTLVEVLVVIGIVGMLVAILMPALAGAKRAAQTITCASQLKSIGTAIRLYADAYAGQLPRGTGRAQWLKTWQPPGTAAPALRLISNVDLDAYWGVAYYPFLASRTQAEASGEEARQIVVHARRFFRCPASVSVTSIYGNYDPDDPVSYGVNGRVTSTTIPVTMGPSGLPIQFGKTTWPRLARFKRPSERIFCHDSAEPWVGSGAQNSLSDFGTGMNLTDWRPGGVSSVRNAAAKLDGLGEFYRHNRSSQVLWLDGHVSLIRYSTGRDVKSGWYDGRFDN